MKEILTLNAISPLADQTFGDQYKLTDAAKKPDGIVLRSFNMHDYDIPDSALCVGRAGAGVNNIPIDKCSERGIVVFNTPGANANAVKELVICGLLLSGRKIIDGIEWTKTLKGKGGEVGKLVEKGKNQFVGNELYGKTLGVAGLGAIGILVANIALKFGMNIIGYDPYISVESAWRVDRHIKKESDLNAFFSACDFITMHMPLTDATRAVINKDSVARMRDGVAILNFSRGELVDSAALIDAVKSGKVSRYVTDFPTDDMIDVPNIICMPHLGASTPEAEDNCAVMVAKQMADFFDNGNITNSVNIPPCSMARQGKSRITVFHKNIKNVINSITAEISAAGVNISNLMSQAKGDYAYLIVDLDETLPPQTLDKLRSTEGTIRIRVI
ncbi:MAG: 3-phosphoglycerate dehydrogenase [Clostridiales bacterium]|nr:3-phosphoglycerate dehydrogenase [Clostridiales bacterium]